MNCPEELGSLLASRSWTLAVSESCTSGLLGHRITSVPGSSEYFLGGIISYSNTSKVEVLGVPAPVLRKYGAVSESTAMAMASAVRDHFVADIGLSTTGIAGPGGGSEKKPVGTVFIGLATEMDERFKEFHFKGNRGEIKQQSVDAALELAIEFLSEQ